MEMKSEVAKEKNFIAQTDTFVEYIVNKDALFLRGMRLVSSCKSVTSQLDELSLQFEDLKLGSNHQVLLLF